MKKLLVFLLVMMLALGMMAVAASASELEPWDGTTLVTITDGADSEVTVHGNIGYTTATDIIDVTIPTDGSLKWFVTELTAPNVFSADFTISNNSEVANLVVTLKSFAAKTTADNTTVDTNLTLNLTGSLLEDAIGLDLLAFDWENDAAPYTAVLAADSDWTFGFNGTYAAPIPATPLYPQYDMVLNFAVE